MIVLPPHVDPPAPVKTDNDINNERREKEKRMNAEGESPIRGARTEVKPVATKEELVAAATDATAEAAAAATIAAMIKNHTGKSHGASAAESKLLAQLFERSRAEGKSFTRDPGAYCCQEGGDVEVGRTTRHSRSVRRPCEQERPFTRQDPEEI